MNTFIILLIVVLVLIFIYNKTYLEGFENTTPIKIIIFVSKSCPHCVTYNKNMHSKIEQFCNQNGISLQRIFSDEDKDGLFEKYNIEYVPAAILIKNDQVTNVSPISPVGIEMKLKNNI